MCCCNCDDLPLLYRFHVSNDAGPVQPSSTRSATWIAHTLVLSHCICVTNTVSACAFTACMFIQDHGIGITADNAYAGLASQYHVSTTTYHCCCHCFCTVLVAYNVLCWTVHSMQCCVLLLTITNLQSDPNVPMVTGLGLW
jgi:hypothetical protein